MIPKEQARHTQHTSEETRPEHPLPGTFLKAPQLDSPHLS